MLMFHSLVSIHLTNSMKPKRIHELYTSFPSSATVGCYRTPRLSSIRIPSLEFFSLFAFSVHYFFIIRDGNMNVWALLLV